MAWKRREKNPFVRGSHFNEHDVDHMETEIARLFQRSRSAIKIVLTNEEIFNLLTPPSHRAENMRVMKRMAITYFANVTEVKLRWSEEADVIIHFNYPYDVLLESAPGFVHEGNEELMQRIDKFVNRRIEIGIEFGRARAVMKYLCSEFTMAQIMYLFPNMIMLIKNRDGVLHDKLKFNTRPRGTDADFPLRQMIEQVTTTLAGTMLLPEGDDEKGNIGLGSNRARITHNVLEMHPFYVY